MPVSGVWQLAGGKRRELIYFLYADEGVPVSLAGEPFQRFTLDASVLVPGRFDGLTVCDADASTVVAELRIDGVSVWPWPQPAPAEGEVLEPPKPFFLHGGSFVGLLMRGNFSKVLFLLQKAEPVLPAKKDGAA